MMRYIVEFTYNMILYPIVFISYCIAGKNYKNKSSLSILKIFQEDKNAKN